MATYDALLLEFDMDNGVDEAEPLWNMILHTSTRSVSKRLFSRMISLYDHHHVPDKIVEVNEICLQVSYLVPSIIGCSVPYLQSSLMLWITLTSIFYNGFSLLLSLKV